MSLVQTPLLAFFLSLQGTAGPGVTPGRVLSLHCPSLSYSSMWSQLGQQGIPAGTK